MCQLDAGTRVPIRVVSLTSAPSARESYLRSTVDLTPIFSATCFKSFYSYFPLLYNKFDDLGV